MTSVRYGSSVLPEQRRPASEAVALYEETAESIEKREKWPWRAK